MNNAKFELQRSAELLAAKLSELPIVKTRKQEVMEFFRAEPAYATSAGRQTLARAVDELVNAATLFAVNSDAARPQVLPMFSGPLTWNGYQIPGRRWGGDNPDNLYRFFPIDGDSAYEVSVQPGRVLPAQFSYVMWDTFMGETTKQVTKGQDKLLDIVIAALVDRDIKTQSDGSFVITIDSSPANGRVNHLRSTADARVVLIRDTFSDWESQDPLRVDVTRISGPEAGPPPDTNELGKRAAHILWGVTDVLHWWINNTEGFATALPNTMGRPYIRGGGWGFSSSGIFKLTDGEALVVTANTLGAKYLSAVVWDPWTVSREHVNGTASLNNNQAQQNQDGSYTYVVSPTDPGIHNWIDTEGLKEGFFFLRWQALPSSLESADGAVRSVDVLKLAHLHRLLASDPSTITPEMRREQLDQRARTFMHHYGFSVEP